MWPVYKKELAVYFFSLRTYVIIAVFMALSGFFFYTSVKFFSVIMEPDVIKGLWENYFDLLRLVLILLLPVLTMGIFAEEKKTSTIELLWSYPLKDREIVLGKFFGCLTVYLLLIVLNAFFPLALSFFYSFSWEPLIACYFGFFLLGTFFISSGMLISFTTENVIVAAVISFSLFIIFWFLTWNESAYSSSLLKVLLHLSVFDRFKPFTKGVITLKEVAFFVCCTVFFLIVTMRAMKLRNWE